MTPPVLPEIQPLKSRKKLWFVGGFVTVVILATGGTWYWYQNKQASPTEERVKKAPEQSIENPITIFLEKLSSRNYRITPTNEFGTRGETLLYEKGQLVRVDSSDSEGSTTLIIKNGKLYTINNINKTFTEFDVMSGRAQLLLSLTQTKSTLGILLQSEVPPITPWSRIEETSRTDVVSYETSGRALLTSLSRGYDPTDIKILVDSTTKLVTMIALKNSQDAQWKTTIFDYQEVPSVESLKRFPSDYTKVE